jgi:hypothetical protein
VGWQEFLRRVHRYVEFLYLKRRWLRLRLTLILYIDLHGSFLDQGGCVIISLC